MYFFPYRLHAKVGAQSGVKNIKHRVTKIRSGLVTSLNSISVSHMISTCYFSRFEPDLEHYTERNSGYSLFFNVSL